MTVEHSTLTGSTLHEPKGVDAAIANRVYVSNGSGSGSWTQVPASAISGLATAFQSNLLICGDVTANGAGSAAVFGLGYTKLPINTVTINQITGASVSSSQITLPAGTFIVIGCAQYYTALGAGATANSKLRIRDVTAGTTLVNGLNTAVTAGTGGDNVPINLPVFGRFVLGAPHILEIQGFSTASVGGLAVGSGESEVYSTFMIWQIA
jgi:hypothetical protein